MAKEKKEARTFDKEAIRRQFEEVRPKYKRLAINIKQSLEIFIKEANIDVFNVYYRIKNFDSFWDKIGRGKYDEPFVQIEDICGLRIICLYDSDIEKIAELVGKELANVELENKRDELEPNQFGYRSLQGPVEIPKEWLEAPNYRGLEGIKAEVQIRTILMHAWAEIQHKLVYKMGTYPEKLDKKFGFISAKLEEADGQFVELRKEREEYREELTENAEEKGVFDVNQPMNIDTLQALLNFCFPNRDKDIFDIQELLIELDLSGISISNLLEYIAKGLDDLPSIELDTFPDSKEGDIFFTQVGAVRAILSKAIPEYTDLIEALYYR